MRNKRTMRNIRVGISHQLSVALVALSALIPGWDVAIASTPGEQIFARCKACHALDRNRTGPKLCGVVGREVGTVKGFFYSTALREFGGTWTESQLSTFLENPMKTIPGTRMGYAGVKKQKDRDELIEYLRQVSNDPKNCR